MLSKLVKLVCLLVLIFLIFTLQPVINFAGKKFITPVLIDTLPTLGMLDPVIRLSTYSYSFPLGIKAKGIDLDFGYKYLDFNQGLYKLSADEVGIRLDFIRSFKERQIVLNLFAEGMLIRSRLLPDSEVPGSAYDYQRYVISDLQAERRIKIANYENVFNLKNTIRESVDSWQKVPVQVMGDLEVSIFNKKHSVLLRDVVEDGVVFEENLLNELSLSYRKPFLESERRFLSKYPLSGLDFLNFKLAAEELAMQIFPLDLDSLGKASILLMHYNLSKYFGPQASLLISRPFGDPISSEYDLASSMGRAAAKKGINPGDLRKVEVLNSLINTK